MQYSTKRIIIFYLLANLFLTVFSVSSYVFPEKKEDGYYLYCIIDLEDANIVSSNLFVMGDELFLSLDVFEYDSKIISRTIIPPDQIRDFFEYDLYVHIKTSKEDISFKKTLLGIKGMLLPYLPTQIPYDSTILTKHKIMPGEYLYKLAEQYSVDRADLEILNTQHVKKIHAGDELIIGTVSFEDGPYEINISLDKCSLTLSYDGEQLMSFPVAIGRGNSTPSGHYHIKRMVEEPALYWEGEYIKPLSPINGLGKWWLELTNPQYGIHGTNRPWEIGKRISHGCIRMFNDDVSLLQKLIPLGTRVVIK